MIGQAKLLVCASVVARVHRRAVRTLLRRRYDRRRVEYLLGEADADAAAVDTTLMHAAHQHCGWIAPDRLGIGVANITSRQPDVRQHVIVEAGKDRGVAAIFEQLEDLAHTSDRD